MRIFTTFCCLLTLNLTLPVLGSSAFAATAPWENIRVTGETADVAVLNKGDLDPANDHFDGLTGDKIARDIDPVDRYSAFPVFAQGLAGPLDRDYDWHGLRDDGRFRPTREFYEAGLLCRDFVEETDHHAVETFPPPLDMDRWQPIILGTACHEQDGWHFR